MYILTAMFTKYDRWKVHSEAIFNEVFVDENIGIKVNRVHVNNIGYIDDSVLIEDPIENIQNIIDWQIHINKKYELKINSNQKFMIVSRLKLPYTNVKTL